MPAALLDTHAFVWGLIDPDRLGSRVRAALAASREILVSSVSLFEIGQKARLGKWPEVAPHIDRLVAEHESLGGRFAAVDAAIALRAGQLAWDRRDPFDRLIAATALERNLTLISADAAFDALLTRVW